MRKKEPFKRVGTFGPKNETVNEAISRLEALIDKCDQSEITLSTEMKVFLLKKVVPELVRSSCLLLHEDITEGVILMSAA